MNALADQKNDLVKCILMLEQAGIIDYNGHASVRLPEDRILINIGNRQRSTLTIEDLCIIDFEGNLLEGDGKPPLEFDSPDSINNVRMASALTDILGDRPAAVMKAHGAVTLGKTIVDAFVLMNYLEDNAERQYLASQIGNPYSFSREELDLCREKLWTASLFQRTWDHFSAKMT